MLLNSIENSECEIVTVAIRRLPTNLKMIVQIF
jgi:thiazole synthase ThiGH ThiG subunit